MALAWMRLKERYYEEIDVNFIMYLFHSIVPCISTYRRCGSKMS